MQFEENNDLSFRQKELLCVRFTDIMLHSSKQPDCVIEGQSKLDSI